MQHVFQRTFSANERLVLIRNTNDHACHIDIGQEELKAILGDGDVTVLLLSGS